MGIKIKLMIVVVIVAALAAAVSGNRYLLIEGGGGVILWNTSEAYFFISIRHTGHIINSLRFPWFQLYSRLGGVEDPDNDRGSLDIIRVTTSNVEHHVQPIPYEPPGSGPGMYMPLENQIYLNYPAIGGLCRWAGNHIEPATADERRRLDGINKLTNRDFSHREDGWSRRSFQVQPIDLDDSFTIEVGDNFQLLASDLAAKNGDRVLSINLSRSGRASEEIWSRALRWGMVSRSQYRSVFHRQ